MYISLSKISIQLLIRSSKLPIPSIDAFKLTCELHSKCQFPLQNFKNGFGSFLTLEIYNITLLSVKWIKECPTVMHCFGQVDLVKDSM